MWVEGVSRPRPPLEGVCFGEWDDWDVDNDAESIVCFLDFNATVMSDSKPRKMVLC